METIINYFQQVDMYTLVSLGILFTLVLATVIYKKNTGRIVYKKTDDIEENSYHRMTDQYLEERSQAREKDEEARFTWFLVDMVIIIIFTLIAYVLFFKKIPMSGWWSIGSSILVYYIVIKPILFNTKIK